ncbi:hypothetical protein NQU17_04555 [Clostridiaceae bacterium HFYG-1003]|nr:hypothetical protein NQU17_04555 [Clostridiaceae bacterium HFYG-1003]
MKKRSLKERLSYQLDLIMSRGTTSLILFLSIITLFLVVLAGIIVIIVERAWANGSVLYAVWKSFTLTLDPGNLASVEGSLGLIIIAAISTVGGIFITSTLISILNTGLSSRIEKLQRGNATIIEQNHTVILGFNQSVFPMIRELQIAQSNQKSGCIVILGNADKLDMEDQIQRRIPAAKTTRIICRSGDPTSRTDLERCSIETCKSIIVNLDEDHEVIRTLLAVSSYLNQETILKEYPNVRKIHIAASIKESVNLSVARIAGQGYADILHFKLIISQIMAHTCYQPGLSSVYMELFNFSGDEIYIESFPQLEGLSFLKAQLAFSDSTVIGISRNGSTLINPDPRTKIEKQDQLILIAEDDHFAQLSDDLPQIAQISDPESVTRYRMASAGKLLILGHSEILLDIMKELDEFLPENSQVTIAGKRRNGVSPAFLKDHPFHHLVIECIEMDITDRSNLEQLLSQDIEHILLLSDSDLTPDQADAKTLTILLQIRDLEKSFNHRFSITSEMLDVRNQELAQVTDVNDFVISSNITGLIMAQVSENRDLNPIFTELLDSDGSEIYLKPASSYLEPGKPINLYTVTQLVSLRHEVFIGFKRSLTGSNGQHTYDLQVNPPKNQSITFSPEDWLVVLAQD